MAAAQRELNGPTSPTLEAFGLSIPQSTVDQWPAPALAYLFDDVLASDGPTPEPQSTELTLIEATEPWRDPDILDRLYNGERDLSCREIAREEFDGVVSRETVRKHLHKHDLMGESGHNRAARLSAEAKQQVDDEAEPESWEKFTLEGRDDVPQTPQKVAADGGRR